MTTYTYHSVTDVDFDAFTAAFNLAYSDYYVPIAMTPDSFRALMIRDDLAASVSVVACDGDTIVGTGLLGLRPPHGWIGGIGVIPTYRRRGIGRQIMHQLIANARASEIETLWLEVIEMNEGAHKLYRDLGFEEQRYLRIYERKPTPLPAVDAGYTIEESTADHALSHYEAFHDIRNCWQRGHASLAGLGEHVQSWIAHQNGTTVGYAIGWSNEFGVRLLDLAASPTTNRIAVGRALLAELHRPNPHAYGSCYNIADNDPVAPAFDELRYTVSFRQIEMRLPLTP